MAVVYWVLGGVVVAVGALCADVQCALFALDRSGLVLADALRSDGVDRIMLATTWIGSLAVLLPLACLVAWRLWRACRRREAGFVVGALLGASALCHFVKLWVMRPRPDLFVPLVPVPADWAYPSAHAMQVTAAALAFFLVAERHRVAWGILLCGAVLAVSASRVYLQVHFPSDVIVGSVVAVLWVMGLHALSLKSGRA